MKKQKARVGKGFGKRLRKLRKGAGLTQKELGEKTGVHPVSIAQYETGACKPSEKSAEKIMAYFETNPILDEPPTSVPDDAPAMKRKRGRPKRAQTEEPEVPKKRGRPRKEKVEIVLDPKIGHRLDNLGASLKTRADAEKHADAMLAEVRRANGQKISKTPVRLGQISAAWLDQQIEAHVHSRGMLFVDGPCRVVVMSKRDLTELCKIMLQVAGVQVNGE